MKKSLLVLTAALVLSVGLSACAPQSGGKAGETTAGAPAASESASESASTSAATSAAAASSETQPMLPTEDIRKNPTTAESTAAAFPLEAAYSAILAEKPAPTVYPFELNTYNFSKEPVTFEVKKAPERIWAQNQDSIEILLALGMGDRIVGACGLDGEVRPDLKADFDKLNYYEQMPSKEEILALNPDFIFGWYSTFEDSWVLGDVDFWHDRGVGTYMALNSACRGRAPQSISHECVDILTIGKICDRQEKARALVDGIQQEVSKITDFLKDKERLSVAVLEDEGGTYRVYCETTLGGNVAITGGANLAVGRGAARGNISAEELIAANPDAIFMVWFNGYTVDNTVYTDQDLTTLITKNPKFASLDAVKNNRVFAINLSGIYCSGMRTLDGILDFSKQLYPELYS